MTAAAASPRPEPGRSAGTIGYNAAGEPTSSSLTDSVTGVASSVTSQQDDMGRPVITSDTDNGKTFSTVEGYTPLGDLQRETFGSAGNSYVKYDYFPTGTNTPSNGSPDALQTMTISPASGSSAANNASLYYGEYYYNSMEPAHLRPGAVPLSLRAVGRFLFRGRGGT